MTAHNHDIALWQAALKMLRGYRSAQVLMTCLALGLYAALKDGEGAVPALAAALDADPEALKRLLNAAAALGLVVKDGNGYANSGLAEACLAPDGPLFIGHLAALEAAGYERWGHLPEAICTGRWPESNRQMEDRSGWVRHFEWAMYDMARATAPAVAVAVDLPVDRPLRLIDVGGGHGGYAMALAQRYPNLTATVYELPAAAEVAREIIAAAGMSERVAVRPGDFQRDDLGRGYDVALLFGVLVSETLQGRIDLLRKVHTALAPGGLVVVREFWLDEADPARSPDAALFSLHILLSNSVGDVATLDDMRSYLANTGFAEVCEVPLPVWADSLLLTARKPE